MHITKGAATMTRQILQKAKDDGLNAQVVLKQAIAKLLHKNTQVNKKLIIQFYLHQWSHIAIDF